MTQGHAYRALRAGTEGGQPPALARSPRSIFGKMKPGVNTPAGRRLV